MENTTIVNKWYNKNWLVVILCVIFFPIGLYALWKNEKISKAWKIGVSVVIGILVIINIGQKDNKTDSTVSTPQTEEKSEKGNSQYINGLNPVDVYLNLEKEGFKTEKQIGGEYGNSWISTQSYAGVDYKVETYSTNTQNVISVRATAMIDVTQKNIIATKQFMQFIATLPYENSQPEEAKSWVDRNFNNDKATITISDATFTIYTPSVAVRILTIEKAK